MGSAFIAGASGRIGRELARLANAAGLEIVGDRDVAAVWLLALPRTVVDEELAIWTSPGARAVIDLSGAFKARGIGTYGLLVGANTLWGDGSVAAQLFGNPGCIAGAVIGGLHRTGVRPFVRGGLHVTAITAGSAAKKTSTGTVRTGVRWWDHPHVAEIERALELPCASFVPVVDYGLDRGIIATISGAVDPAASRLAGGADESIDVAEVWETSAVRCHLRIHDHPTLGPTFTLTVALDNLTFPAANAVELAVAWMAARG